MNDDEETIRSQLSRAQAEDDPPEDPQVASFEDVEAEAAYWRTRFEQERERLAKLWVAYRDVEAELELRKEEADTIAQRKAAAQLAQAEQAQAPSDDEAEQPGVLAIAPPDEFEVVCEAEERDVVVGRGTSFPLVFVNRSDSPVAARLTVEESPEGWSALTAEQDIELDSQSSQTVYVLVRPPAEAPVGEEGRVIVTVETVEKTEHLELVAEVVEPSEADDESVEEEPIEAQAPAKGSLPDDEPVNENAGDEDSEAEERLAGPTPFGDIHGVEDVEGIGETFAGKLGGMGIEDTEELWQASSADVAEALDASPRVVRRWQSQAELMAVKGVGPQFAELLARSGVVSIEVLAACDPGGLFEDVEAKQESLEVRIQGGRLNGDRVRGWIEAARDHDAVAYRTRRSGPPEDPEATPFGDIHGVEDVEGIGETFAGKLRALGIEDTEELWQASSADVAEGLDASPRVVRRWQSQAELMAVNGVGPQFAELLARSGVVSIEVLAACDPGELLEDVEAKQESLEVRIQGGRLNEDRVRGWIEAVRDHDPGTYRTRRSGPPSGGNRTPADEEEPPEAQPAAEGGEMIEEDAPDIGDEDA